MWNLKRNDTTELTYETETDSDLENELTVARRKDGEGIVRAFGMDMYTLLYLKWKPTRTYCIAQGALLSVMWQSGWEGSLGKMHTCI